MKSLRLFLILSFFLIACGLEEDEIQTASAEKSCESNSDCQIGYVCDIVQKICTNGENEGSNDGDSGMENGSEDETGSESGEGENSDEHGGNGSVTGPCAPGQTQICPYTGPEGTDKNPPCKAGMRECREDGTWSACYGEITPVYEKGDLCSNGVDDDCNGVIDEGTDVDGDGHGACTDCCDTTEQCADPKSVWDASDQTHVCKYEEIVYECDSEVAPDSINPFDYAKAIGICPMTTEDSSSWGLISATISAPNGTATVHAGSNGLLSAFGNVIKPKDGNLMLALTSSKLGNPITDPDYSGGTTSAAPSDWLTANGGQFPAAASCPTSGRTGTVYDAVMLTLRIKTPATAKSFSFNIYFITKEYPNYICSDYNDFFIALLDSGYESDDPELQNPKDKNLAMDSIGNPVGINLAPAGLFTQCENYPSKGVTSCIGKEELQGTGFASNGGTGWLTTRGNVVGGETITLRLAIWDLKDHWYDSIVLIDNFRWDVSEHRPGTDL